jgi:mono/diheme cytochrome c family protein
MTGNKNYTETKKDINQTKFNRMKKFRITGYFLSIVSAVALFSSCSSKQQPGLTYMPDMGYSRAYESYALLDSAKFTLDAAKRGGNTIFYNSMPVKGTMKRGELFPYTLGADTTGSYAASSSLQNPVISLDSAGLKEAGRLYNINCGICHGDKAAGNGPLSASGKIGGVANLTLPVYTSMSDGTMFHVMTYGKGVMGSYASQLSRRQRWEIVKYVRTLQNPKAAADSTGAASTDSSVVKKG